MLKSVISAAAIFILLFSIFFIPANAASRRCGEKMPETLLALYQNSDAIHIARFDKTEDGEITEQTDEYTAISIKKHFSISSTLKGESRKFFVLDEVDYRFKGTVEESEEHEEDPEDSVKLDPGDTLLLFLKTGEDEESFELTDYRDGTKKLTTGEIGVYEARIKELNKIFDAEKVDEFEIVRWLIRCAEDPITRWEGTFELLQSFQNLDWKAKEAERRDESLNRGEAVEQEETAEPDKDGVFMTGTTTFAKILDPNQKQALSNLLFDRPSPDGDTADKAVIAGDAALVELVQMWGDSRLPVYLLNQLRAGSLEPYEVSQLMTSIAGVLGDDEITELAGRYAEISYEEDSAEVPNEAQPGELADADPAEKDVVISVKELEAEVPENTETQALIDEEAAESETAAPKKRTYKEVKDDILSQFLVRSEQVMAEKEQANDLEVSDLDNP